MQLEPRWNFRALVMTAALLPLQACSSSGDGGGGGGPQAGTPAMTTGGAPSGAGASFGGSLGTAGSSGTVYGGQTGTGGSPSSTGGASGSATGGQPATAGTGVGGGSGGAGPGSGGSKASGGAGGGEQAGSSGSSPTAGAPGTGAPAGAAPSAGCGKAASLMNGKASMSVGGKTREYILALPNDYDPNHPYRLIFGWHPWGGSAQQVASGNYYGLVGQAKGSAIFVAPDGLDFGGNGKGWGNSNGEDIAFLEAMLDRFRSELCIDENRIFSTGFSFGGMFSFAAGCSSKGMMRAIAPMAGNTQVAGCESGTRSVAVMGFHGVDDQVVGIDGGRKGRDTFVQRNGCSMTTAPAETTWCESAGQNYQPCTCVSYQGCKDGYPVTWCEYKGQHMPAPNSAAALWAFFSQF